MSSGVDGQTAVPTFTLLPSFPSLQARTRRRPSDSCLTHPQSCQHSINLRDRRRRVRETTPPPPPHVRRFLMGLTPTSHPSKTLDADGIDPRTNSKRTSGPPSSSPAALSGLQTAGEPTDHHHLLPLPLPPDPVVTLRCLGPPTNSNQLIAMSMCPFLDPHRTTHPSQWIKSEVSRAYRGGQPWLPSFFFIYAPLFFSFPTSGSTRWQLPRMGNRELVVAVCVRTNERRPHCHGDAFRSALVFFRRCTSCLWPAMGWRRGARRGGSCWLSRQARGLLQGSTKTAENPAVGYRDASSGETSSVSSGML